MVTQHIYMHQDYDSEWRGQEEPATELFTRNTTEKLANALAKLL